MSAPHKGSAARQPADIGPWIDAIADRFEQAWGTLTPPAIANFLGQATGADRTALLQELILLDLEWRARLGARRSMQDYRNEFPELEHTGLVLPTQSTAAPPPALATIPGYEDIEEIGRGGMGVVCKARQVGLNRIVALKMILGGAQADSEERTRFRLEAEAVARLEHPHIVQVHEVGELNGQPFLALEYIDGGTLEQNLAHKPQPARDAAALVEKLARAIHAAHQRGIVHRDLKPANVLLTSKGEPKISDFGLAKRLDSDSSNTCSGTILGTPCYMAPEQARGQASRVGPAADTYALGVILYEMLIGRPPFQGATKLETIEQVCDQEPVPPRRLQPRVPRDLETICLKCLRKDPLHRFASALELADDLRRFLQGKPIKARPVQPWERAGKWIKRNKARTALAAAVLTLVLGVAGWAWYARKQKEQSAARHAADLVGSLAFAETADVSGIIENLSPYRRWADPLLYQRLAATAPDTKEHLHLRMALAPVSGNQVDYLFQRLLVAKPAELPTIRTALERHQDAVKERFWAVLADGYAGKEQRVRAACALADYDPDSGRWAEVCREVAGGLAAEPALALGTGKELLRPIRTLLVDPLLEVFLDGKRTDAERATAFALLADYAGDRADVLAELDCEADDQQHAVLLPRLRLLQHIVAALMRRELHKRWRVAGGGWRENAFLSPSTLHPPPATRLFPPPSTLHPPPFFPPPATRHPPPERQARAAIALVQLGDAEIVWPLLRHSADPALRSYLLHDLGRRGTAAALVIDRLTKETDVSARRALILSLGEFTGDQISAAQRRQLLPFLLRWYQDDPDPGIHGAIDWLLRNGRQGEAARQLDWGQRDVLAHLDRKLASLPPGKRNWYVSRRERVTLALIHNPEEFVMGTPPVDPKDENQNELSHRVRIPRSFAIATKEVTVAQFNRFLADNPRVKARHKYQKESSPEEDGPIIGVTWFQAAQFCNWLSKQEGLPRAERCYPDLEEFDYGMVLPADYLDRQGYRLPTEAEWEYACRAGATTSRFYGTAEDMLKEYAWYSKTANKRTFPVGQLKPNDLGLFDVLGNAMEWCQDVGDDYRVAPGEVRIDVPDTAVQVTKAQPRVLRGGSFFYLGRSVRSAFRDYYRPDFPLMYVGLRVARTLPSR